jgi:hypothetical protein
VPEDEAQAGPEDAAAAQPGRRAPAGRERSRARVATVRAPRGRSIGVQLVVFSAPRAPQEPRTSRREPR